jgi:hypothetical protein
MTWRILLVVGSAVAATGLSVAAAAGGDVNVGISIGAPAPPPPFVVAAPPPLVIVRGTPVYHVPSASFNLFVYGGRYYSFHSGVWFHAAAHNGPWVLIATERVPKAVLGVPVTYYKIPPGQAKKMGVHPGAGPGHGKGPKGKKGWND